MPNLRIHNPAGLPAGLLRCLAVVAAFAMIASVTAQADPAGGPSGDPVAVSLEAYLVTTATRDDGTVEEVFAEADAARPGQVVEYRVTVRNVSDETLPAATVAVTGPVPATTSYLADSATPSDEAARTEFSADGGASFAEPPVVIVVQDENGDDVERIVAPADYTAVRWTLLEPLDAGAQRTFVYRAQVR